MERGRKYYEAYDDRYRKIHSMGLCWSSDEPTPIVADVISRYGIPKEAKILETGCGEGRDAFALLDRGFDVLATDVSSEAVEHCRRKRPEHAGRFRTLDRVAGGLKGKFPFIYSVAVIHMLTEDSDRHAYLSFIREHLEDGGLALICTMGDGTAERSTDPALAFDEVQRSHDAGPVTVAATTMRMVSFGTFEKELDRAGLETVEKGLTPSFPDFNELMYAMVKKKDRN